MTDSGSNNTVHLLTQDQEGFSSFSLTTQGKVEDSPFPTWGAMASASGQGVFLKNLSVSFVQLKNRHRYSMTSYFSLSMRVLESKITAEKGLGLGES